MVEVWDDSTRGDYLWSAGNVREAIPGVMTPCTWSVVQPYITESAGPQVQAGHPLFGNIHGRLYMNLSVSTTVARKLGAGWVIEEMSRQAFGPIAEGLEVPEAPMTRRAAARSIGLYQLRVRLWILANSWRFRSLLDQLRYDCLELLDEIDAAATPEALLGLWESRIEPAYRRACRMIRFTVPTWMNMAVLHRVLRSLVGDDRANVVATGTGNNDHLASLDLALGLEALRDGSVDDREFARRYGHRAIHEHELAEPRAGERAEWLERVREAPVGTPKASDALREQARRREVVWAEIRGKSRLRQSAARALVQAWARNARRRESVRDDCTRVFWVLRNFVLRAGDLTGAGDDLFMLTIDEILEVLRADTRPLDLVPSRRATFEHYRDSPAPPVAFRGAASDTNPSAPIPGVEGLVVGAAGALGTVTGIARVVTDLVDADDLRPGEILVTEVTNVGWTPYFAVAAAIVTDIGAPLSHAAIVAREFGIPAVVGCGNATRSIRTGDQVVVDGAAGTVIVRQGKDRSGSTEQVAHPD